MEYFVHIGEDRIRVQLQEGRIVLDGEAFPVELLGPREHPIRVLRADGRSHRLVPSRNGKGRWRVEIDGQRHEAEVLDRGQEAIRAARMAAGGVGGPEPLVAPMPGLVLRIEVAEGELVSEGQGVAIVEAMKMENELTAPVDARVGKIHVSEGTAVEKGQILVEFDSSDEDEDEEDG